MGVRVFTLAGFCLLVLLGFISSNPSWGAEADTFMKMSDVENLINAKIEIQQMSLNHMWTMIAAALVALMQTGFLLLEAGMVRSKNSINVAQKNISDFVFSCAFFYIIGFALMFGPSTNGFFGWSPDYILWNKVEDWQYTFFVFQMVFCGTAATIVSGAVAERMKYTVYIIMSVCISALIYPVFGYMAWGNLFNPENTSFLINGGFIDFAGSTVVHSIGGWVSLAGVIVVGPRIGKFNKDGTVNTLNGHSHVLATAGALILWVGWIGFNGGSTTVGSPAFAHIISNTMLAASFGGLIATIIGRIHDGIYRPERSINGVLAGLVGITAGCDAVSTISAVIIGLICGVVVHFAAIILEKYLKLDDVIGAIPVHGVCGATGTLLVGFLAEADKLAAPTRLDQIIIQAEGVAIAFLWAFGVAFIIFKLLDMTMGIRVTKEEEEEGLNAAEHGTSLGTGVLQKHLNEIFNVHKDLTQRLDCSSGDEAAEVAMILNNFLGDVHGFVRNIKRNSTSLDASSVKLAGIACELSSSSEELTTKSCQTSESTDMVSQRISSSTKAISDITSDIGVISDNATEMSQNLDMMAQAIEKLSSEVINIAENSNSADRIADDAIQMSKEAYKTMQSLNEASESVKDMLEIIKSVANKTNILSINASIEATRAGEAGRSFAVVAEEVKTLANKTASAAGDMENKISNVHSSITNVLDVMDNMSNIINIINESVKTISVAANQQKVIAENIASGVKANSANASGIAEKINQISAVSRNIAEDIVSVSGETTNIANTAKTFHSEASRTSQNTSYIKDNSSRLSDMAKNLNDEVSKYKTD